MNVDPSASMRTWAVEVELGGRTFEVPALPAADWFPVLAEGDLLRVVDMIESTTDGPDLDDMILAGQVTGEEITQVLTEVIEEVTGRPFHTAVILAAFSASQWPSIGGELARRGFRWDVMPIGAALDALYLTIVERVKPDQLPRFHALLEQPLPTGGRSRKHRENALSDFEAMAGPKPEGVRSTGVPSGNARPRTQQRRQRPRQAGP
jgi:hypothetical protein